jgi:hypothetical protein
VSRHGSATRERGCSYSKTNGLQLGHFELLRFLRYSHEVANTQEGNGKIFNKINSLYCQYKLRCISGGASGVSLLLDLPAGFFRLRRGEGRPGKDQDFPVSRLSQFIIMGSNRLRQSEINFLSMGSKMGSIWRRSMQKLKQASVFKGF